VRGLDVDRTMSAGCCCSVAVEYRETRSVRDEANLGPWERFDIDDLAVLSLLSLFHFTSLFLSPLFSRESLHNSVALQLSSTR